ncbi:MAG: AraC family transcriptional regulator [Deltaproteobacteria bacterium]
MTDTARNELAPKMGSSFGTTHLAPALTAPPEADGTFEARRFLNGENRTTGEPESGIRPAMNPAALHPAALHPAALHPPEHAHHLSAPPSLSVDLVLSSVIESQVPPGWSSPMEELSGHELTVIVRGSQTTIREDGEATSGPVEALVLRVGTRREERNAGEVDLHRLRITFHWRNAPADLPEMVQDTCGRLHEIASWLVAERDAQFPNVSDYRQGLLRALVGEYLRLSVVAASRIEEKTRTYMLRHLGEPITLEDLASNIGMSRYYFCRVYKEVAGHTPMEHLRALRLERAKDLIRSTALPLKAIAPEVGFGSAQHLCRLLHDRFGVGVRELRGAGTLESRGVVTDRSRDPDQVS